MIALVTTEPGKVPCMETGIVYVLFDPEVTLILLWEKIGVKHTSRSWVTRLSTHLVPVSGNVIQGLAWVPHLVNDPLHRDMKYNTWVRMRWCFNLPHTVGLQDRMLPARAVLGCVSALLLLRAYRIRQLWFVHIRDAAIFPPTHFFVFNYSWPVYYWYILTYCTFFP